MNRRALLSLLGASPALLSSLPAKARQTQSRTPLAKPSATQPQVVGLNPKGTPPPIQLIPMAPRLASLDGKTVWLVDTGFDGGGMLLDQIRLWFNQNLPAVKVIFRRKAGPYMEDDPALWKEIKEKGDAAVMAIGH